MADLPLERCQPRPVTRAIAILLGTLFALSGLATSSSAHATTATQSADVTVKCSIETTGSGQVEARSVDGYEFKAVLAPTRGTSVESDEGVPGTVRSVDLDSGRTITITVAVQDPSCNPAHPNSRELHFSMPVRFTYVAPARCGRIRAHYREHGTRQYVEASHIVGARLSCHRARHVASAWSHASRLSERPARRGAGFHCRYEREGTDLGIVTCTLRRMQVAFDAYDSSPFH